MGIQDPIAGILLSIIFGGIFILVLINWLYLLKLRNNSKKDSQSIDKMKSLDHPLFKLDIMQIEAYITIKYTNKLASVIENHIEVNNPDRHIELYALSLVQFTEDISGMMPLFIKYFGPKYIEVFTTNLFNELKRDGYIDKMILKYGLM